MYTAAVFLLMAVMIPYMPEEYPLKADIHVLLAFFRRCCWLSASLVSSAFSAPATGCVFAGHGVSCG